ncbi:hypothetical protein EMIHUDRAFT_233536 [Emiliania huxleyi CCMP1516]|uniref:Uncharacterized protein n=2 Tax=Emiliania huxleyi TaxID=2903 RepID=A0A0D3K205_EMIH1|nr:hypothetical protein EMIHUDRAFT_233536 [Emiliania huxleyi CCMP1516]EOD29790.1 hypothetical protein EMIHUDRAFT_233536 [Emiliania huxleyi CCMP1516]|eukprot:XP_005782219.1 hypothetical protein EMIHUDRAFT_233536 [Emiliania huxleyi CCMP1516]
MAGEGGRPPFGPPGLLRPTRPVEAGLGPARDGWPPTSALALLVKMAAVAIAATKVQAYSAQAPVVFRLFQKLLARTAADSAIAAAAVELSRKLEVLTRFLLEFFYPHDSEHECIRGILWVVQTPEYRPLASPPDRVELIGAGSLGYGTGPSFG